MTTSPASDPARKPSRRGWVIGGIIVVVLVALVTVPALLFGGDRGFEKPEETPEDVLKDAKAALDDADNVKIAITAEDIPAELSTALVSADGTAVRPDGFSGVLNVRFGGGTVDADVVAVDGTTYAELPFVGWSEVDPEDYNAPDPSLLLDPEEGISGLLTALGDPASDGDDAETCADGAPEEGFPYTGTLTGEEVRGFIPGADDGEFDVRVLVGEQDRPCRVDLTGVFYPGEPAMTYSVVFSDYDDPDPVEITRP